jgi:hypothetical protein
MLYRICAAVHESKSRVRWSMATNMTKGVIACFRRTGGRAESRSHQHTYSLLSGQLSRRCCSEAGGCYPRRSGATNRTPGASHPRIAIRASGATLTAERCLPWAGRAAGQRIHPEEGAPASRQGRAICHTQSPPVEPNPPRYVN